VRDGWRLPTPSYFTGTQPTQQESFMRITDKNLQQCIMSFDEYFKDELLPQPEDQPNQQSSTKSSTPKASDGQKRPLPLVQDVRLQSPDCQQEEEAASSC
jgi:hypothetical protein